MSWRNVHIDLVKQCQSGYETAWWQWSFLNETHSALLPKPSKKAARTSERKQCVFRFKNEFFQSIRTVQCLHKVSCRLWQRELETEVSYQCCTRRAHQFTAASADHLLHSVVCKLSCCVGCTRKSFCKSAQSRIKNMQGELWCMSNFTHIKISMLTTGYVVRETFSALSSSRLQRMYECVRLQRSIYWIFLKKRAASSFKKHHVHTDPLLFSHHTNYQVTRLRTRTVFSTSARIFSKKLDFAGAFEKIIFWKNFFSLYSRRWPARTAGPNLIIFVAFCSSQPHK
jgi:hypothetical protein